MSSDVKNTKVVILLIRVTNYDERGFPQRFRWGVLPSNSLAALNSLTREAMEKIMADDSNSISNFEIKVLDDSVWSQRISNPQKIIARYKRDDTQVVVGLVGVQTNQFARATHLAEKFQQAGAQVVIGGFHVSGIIATYYDGISSIDKTRKDLPCPNIMPKEITALTKNGVIVCMGEGENIWQKILEDIISDDTEDIYRGGRPDLSEAPLPSYPPGYFRRFSTEITTFDLSRGCPLACNFCTVINVQGRKVRSRNPQKAIAMAKEVCRHNGRISAFFTDDNFARNPDRDEILDGFISLRKEGYGVSFMIQADLRLHAIDGFIDKLSEAGCSQVFLGMESVNPENLIQVGKKHNHVEEYRPLIEALHEKGIMVHVGYIIGFDADTTDGVLKDVQTIKDIGVDQASFFILTPLPGSADHITMFCNGVKMDADFNRYDSAHVVCEHPKMSRKELERLFYLCYKEFYRSAQMIAALKRLPANRFSDVIRIFLWYRNGMLSEHVHPMMCGFLSVRSRKEIRPDYDREGLFIFWAKEIWHKLKYLGCCFREFYIFQHVYFEVTGNEKVSGEVSRRLNGLRDWFSRTFVFYPNRNWLNDFWKRYGKQKWKLFYKPNWHWKMIPHAITEIVYSWKFWRVFSKSISKMRRKK
jgi:radical SAM superfamily enzyme YgiQ (UPF0313 family)